MGVPPTSIAALPVACACLWQMAKHAGTDDAVRTLYSKINLQVFHLKFSVLQQWIHI